MQPDYLITKVRRSTTKLMEAAEQVKADLELYNSVGGAALVGPAIVEGMDITANDFTSALYSIGAVTQFIEDNNHDDNLNKLRQ